MSYCLNPDCQKPENPDGYKFCQSCGFKLVLGDRYRPIKPIGQGGFGRTFLALDEYKPSKPRCVIKQFFPQIQSSSNAQKAAELFDREAVRLDELGKHPQIPELLAHFRWDNSQYLVQEFIDGQTLAKELEQEGAFTEVQLRELLQNLLPVLQFVHEKQVIHRDIKPENIIRRMPSTQILEKGNGDPVNPGGAKGGQLVLVDFGASKFATVTAIGKTGTVIGTVGYVAPEQFVGKAVPASDLYGLGVTCVELLSAIAPLDLFDVSEGTWKWRDYLQYPITQELAFILDKLLEANLNQRYQSAVQVLEDLQNLPPLTNTATQKAPNPQAARSQPRSNPQAAPANKSFISRIIGGTPQMIKGTILENFGKYEAAIASYDRAISLQPNNPDAWYRKARLCADLSDWEEALFCYEKTLELKPNRLEAWRDRGILLYKLKRYEESVSNYLQCLKFQPDWPLIWLLLSAAIKQVGNSQEAETTLEQARQILPQNANDRALILWQAWEILIKN